MGEALQILSLNKCQVNRILFTSHSVVYLFLRLNCILFIYLFECISVFIYIKAYPCVCVFNSVVMDLYSYTCIQMRILSPAFFHCSLSYSLKQSFFYIWNQLSNLCYDYLCFSPWYTDESPCPFDNCMYSGGLNSIPYTYAKSAVDDKSCIDPLFFLLLTESL